MDGHNLRLRALRTMEEARDAMLATVEGDQPRVRPVRPVKVDGFTVYIANQRRFAKTRQIERNPKVELCFLSPANEQVRIAATAAVVQDEAIRREVWEANPLLREWLRSFDNPEYLLYRMSPTRVTWMREWSVEYREVPL